MKLVKLNEQLHTLDGVVIGGEENKIRSVFANSLGVVRNVTGEEKIRAFALGKKLIETNDDEMDVSIDEVNILKKSIDQGEFMAFAYVQAMDCIQE